MVIVATDRDNSRSGGRGGPAPLGEEAARALGAHTIAFNPVSITGMVKALRSVAEAEAARAVANRRVFKVGRRTLVYVRTDAYYVSVLLTEHVFIY